MVNWLKRQWQEHPPETAFLGIAIVFGLLFVFLVPPTQAADETTHFNRAFELSQGHILSKSQNQGYGDYLPKDVYTVEQQLFANIPSHYERHFNYRQIPGLLKQKINYSNKTFVHLEGSTVYSPIPYIPQIAAILVAKLVWPSVVFMYYLARLANLAIWIVLMWLAMKLWPANKWPIFALALTPMSLSQAATASPDALGNSLAFLTISAAIYFAKRHQQMTAKEIWLLFAGVVLLSLTKPVFFVLGLLGFLLVARQFSSVRRYLVFIGGLILSGLVVTAAWNSRVKQYGAGIQHYYYPTVFVSERHQLLHVLGHPFSFIYTLGRSYLTSLGNAVSSSFIGRLGWWDTDLPTWLVSLTYTLITLSIINRDPKEVRFSRRIRYISLIIFAAGFVMTSLILYLTITDVGSTAINNIQGRYFIAFTPLLVPALAGLLKVQDWNKIARRLFPISYSIILAISLIVVVNRFV